MSRERQDYPKLKTEKLPSHHKLAWPTLVVMRQFGRPVHNSEVAKPVANLLEISPELAAEPLNRGKRTRLDYKLGWARTLLRGIGAIEKIEPAVWAVTERGRAITEADVFDETQKMLDRLNAANRQKRSG